MEDGKDSAAGPSQRTYLAESSAEAGDERSRWLATVTKKKAKRSVHRRSQERKKRTTKSSKVESTYWRVSASHAGIVLLAPTKPSSVSIAPRALPACAMRGARHHTHAYS